MGNLGRAGFGASLEGLVGHLAGLCPKFHHVCSVAILVRQL